ncbi:TPA: hypothetical protein R9Y26_006242 [Bacillus cereus]|nr:hypothetical protein [Bacillus cereus]
MIRSPKIYHIQLPETLIDESSVPNILGNRGYISRSIQGKLAQKGVTITTPLHKNMEGADKIKDILLGKQRKNIETVFSPLEKLVIKNFRSRSLLYLKVD